MLQTSNLGLSTKKITETNHRYIDAENDTYPPFMNTRSASMKVNGGDKLLYAISYFQIGRVREILLDIQKDDNQYEFDIYVSDYYGQGLLSQITLSNHPNNIMYIHNKEIYERMFITVLETLTPENLKKLFKYSLKNKNKFHRDHVTYALKNLSDRPHMLLALWNYGLLYTKEHIKLIKDPQIKAVFNKTIGKDFVPKHRYSLLNAECPITYNLINQPGFCTDGYVYELKDITKYYKNSNNSPMTKVKMTCESNSIHYKDKTGKYRGVKVSTKIIYNPTHNRFIHFDLV